MASPFLMDTFPHFAFPTQLESEAAAFPGEPDPRRDSAMVRLLSLCRKVVQRVDGAEADQTCEKHIGAQDDKDEAQDHAAGREYSQRQRNHAQGNPEHSISKTLVLSNYISST